MSTVWLEEIGAHYARTLELWRERFIANADLAARARLRRAVPPTLDALAGDERGRVPRATATGRAGALRQATALQLGSRRIDGRRRRQDSPGHRRLRLSRPAGASSSCCSAAIESGPRSAIPAREREVHAAVASQVDPAHHLTVHQADLMSDDHWDNVIEGCDYVLHVASPFPPKQPKDPDELIVPAREGTLRVLGRSARPRRQADRRHLLDRRHPARQGSRGARP